jgi:hypothetical protein
METWDDVKQQAQTMSFPWAEVGDTKNVSIVVTPTDEMWPAQ